jgi:salicylate hydroxylase
LHVLRSDLHNILVDEFNRHSPGCCELNTCIQSYSESESAVTINTSDGRSFECDCLLGADGIKSKIKSQLSNNEPSIYTGNVAWRGVVPANRLPKNFMAKIATNYVGPRKHMVIYYLRDQQLVNFVGVVENQDWKIESWSSTGSWQDLKADFDGWHPTVQTLIDAVDKDQCFRWALHHHLPLKCWSSKRVTLLGDAAHAMLPFMASGAAMAIEDARILQRSIDQSPNISDALQLYQANRIPRTTKVQRMSVQAGKLYHIQSKGLLKVVFSGLKLLNNSRGSFLAEYDANSVSLCR